MGPIEIEIKRLFERLLSLDSSNSLDILRNLVHERLAIHDRDQETIESVYKS